MSDDFAGLTAIVTGGASGIGAAIAAGLQSRGARVGVLDLAHSSADGVRSYQADVSDDGSVRAAVTAAAAELGGIDIVINNAEIGAQSPLSGSTTGTSIAVDGGMQELRLRPAPAS